MQRILFGFCFMAQSTIILFLNLCRRSSYSETERLNSMQKKIEINQNSNFVPNPNPNNKNISNFPMRLSKIISSSVFEVRNSKVRNLHLTLDIYRPYSITTTLLQSNQSNTYKIQLGSNSVELFTKFFLNSQRCKAYPSELNG